jgi:hypothetical protein
MELNVATAHHRIVLRNGNPVEDGSPSYQLLSMLTEDSGWPMEETPRQGSLVAEFAETGQDTPTQFKAAVERRAQPLIEDRTIVSAECTSVRQDVRRDGSAIFFNLLYKQSGQPEQTAEIELSN